MPDSAHSGDEQARSLLQSRVALFWKVMFAVGLLSFILGSLGAMAEPGWDHALNLLSTLESGTLWLLCRRGRRSLRFSRWADAGGLWVNVTIGAVLGRYFAGQFALERPLEGPGAEALADGFISMVLLGGMTMMLAIRAALVPSRPRRTILVTAVSGLPVLACATLLEPTTGALTLRDFGDAIFPWLPPILALMWGFVIIACAVISWVVYSLRAEVREARQLGQYVLGDKLGEGGMGEVYRARHGMMRRDSAVKLLPPSKSDETDIRRFEQEVRLTAQLTHPNTITIFDYGRTADDVFYYAMELLDGATLERVVALDGAQPEQRVVRVLSMVCGALVEAHGIGLIHRDIKPANIMLCTQGGEQDVVKVLDFGLVKMMDVDKDVNLTGLGAIVGTPQYMAPESITDPESVDARTDLYAVGAVGYFLLTGKPVFEASSVVEVCGKHLHEQPVAPSNLGVDVSPNLERIVLSCLQKDPAQRPQTAAELRRQLQDSGVQPWTSEQAQVWWRAHHPRMHTAPMESTTAAHTIARVR